MTDALVTGWTIGSVIDALVAIPVDPLYAAVYADGGGLGSNSPVLVSDGLWATSNDPDQWVVIGDVGMPDTPSGEGVPGGLRTMKAGVKYADEDYHIHCHAAVVIGDVQATKKARDRVLALFKPFQQRLLNRPDLGVLPNGQAWIDQATLTQGSSDIDSGSSAEIDWLVRVHNVNRP